MIKPLYSGMAEITRGAIAKIKAVTAPARAIALWYKQNPSNIYLPPELEPLRQLEWITVSEVAQILGFAGAPAGLRWCQDNNVTIQPKRGATLARFVEVEQRIVSMLPQGFPFLNRELGLLYSEALIIVRKNELHADKRTYACMIEPVSTDAINRAFGCKHQRSLFEKFGFSEPDGSRIRVTTHMFRHYLHTIGKMSGLSELDLAKLAGRIDLRQNQAYNHVTPDQMLAKMRDAVGDQSLMFGPLGKAPDKRLIRRSEFAELKIPTAHVTKIGFCVHAYVQSPCQIHRDCINCEELVCVKGDAEKNEEVKRQLSEARLLLEKAEQASSGGYCGSDRWVVHQKATVERLSQLCAILEDPTVPPGSFISLSRPHANSELDSKSSGKRKRTKPRKQLTGGGEEH